MFLADDIEGGILATVVVGAAAILLAPVVLPVVVQVGRPLVKGAVKGGILCFERSREAMHEVGEIFEDVVAEARAEMEQARMQSARQQPAGAAAADAAAAPPASAAAG